MASPFRLLNLENPAGKIDADRKELRYPDQGHITLQFQDEIRLRFNASTRLIRSPCTFSSKSMN